MLFRPVLAIGLASLAGCATAGPGQDQPVDAAPGQDSALPIDAPFQPQPDAANCATVEMELLNNGNFDTSPLGTGWTEQPIIAGDQLVVDSAAASLASHTAPNKAWLGGYARSPNSDMIYQDVPVPPGTSNLVLSGQYVIATQEFLPGSYDLAQVDIASTSGNSYEVAAALDDNNATSTWTAFSKPFGNAHAGETVRVRVMTSGDASYPTSFFFDSLSLKATVKPPGCP